MDMIHILDNKYICRLTVAISAVICLLSLSCCIEDVSLDEKEVVNATVNGTQVGESMTLKTDLEGFVIHGEPTERGFVMTRMEDDWQVVDTLKVPLDGPFEATVTDDLWNGLKCKVYAYVKASEKKFRTADMAFTAKNGAAPVIKSVTITPDSYSVTGTIRVEGEHLTRFARNVDVRIADPVKGAFYARTGKRSNESMEIAYRCCNIGTFGVILTVNGHEFVLDKKINVDCATLNNFDNNPVYGMPTLMDISTTRGDVKWVKCVLDHENELSTKNTFYGDKKWYTAFVGKGSEHTALVSFHDGDDEIFFPEEKITFHYVWEKVAQTSRDFKPQTFGAGAAWELTGDRDHPWLGVRLKRMDPETGNVSEYKLSPDSYQEINGYTGNFKAFYEDGKVYCMASFYTGDWAEDGHAFTRLLEFDVQTEKWTQLVDLKCEQEYDSQTYRSFAKVGNVFYFANCFNGQWATWNSKTQELAEGYSGELIAYYDEFCGYDKEHFYYHFNELMSISLADFTTKQTPIPNIQALYFKAEPGMCTSPVIVHDGLICHGNIGMTQSTSNMDEVTYYGLPMPKVRTRYMMPIGNEMYYLMENGEIFKYKNNQ